VNKYRDILSLKPTQFAVGILEIQAKVQEIEAFSKSERKKLIRKTPVPVVRGPDKEFYIVDHHHFAFVCWHLGIKKVKIEIVRDFTDRKMTYAQFWAHMKKLNLFYPYCQFGEGPRHPVYLPVDIRGLADDPYRSLAWFVRKEGGYENSTEKFAEFQWANFFRDRKLLYRHGRSGFGDSIEKALKLARSKQAKGLPGFTGARASK
jgi:hypothetical protein